MKMKMSSFCWFILSTVIHSDSAYANNSMASRYFLFTVPRLHDDKSDLKIYFTALTSTQANVTTPWIKSVDPKQETVELYNESPRDFRTLRHYQSRSFGGTGPSHSYLCMGNGPFAVTVFFTKAASSRWRIESVQIVPVGEWVNDSYAFTVLHQPSAQIVTAMGPNKIEIKVHQSNTELIYEVDYKQYDKSQTVKIDLKQEEANWPSVCTTRDSKDVASLAGLQIRMAFVFVVVILLLCALLLLFTYRLTVLTIMSSNERHETLSRERIETLRMFLDILKHISGNNAPSQGQLRTSGGRESIQVVDHVTLEDFDRF